MTRILWLNDLPIRTERFTAPEPYQAFWLDLQVNPSVAQLRAWQDEARDAASGLYQLEVILAHLCRGWSLAVEPSREAFAGLPAELQQWAYDAWLVVRNTPLGKPTPNGSAPISAEGAPLLTHG